MTVAEHPADSYDIIRVRGACENNLKNVSVDIPKRQLTVFAGVSGSGKSSLVFATSGGQSQRMINALQGGRGHRRPRDAARAVQ